MYKFKVFKLINYQIIVELSVMLPLDGTKPQWLQASLIFHGLHNRLWHFLIVVNCMYSKQPIIIINTQLGIEVWRYWHQVNFLHLTGLLCGRNQNDRKSVVIVWHYFSTALVCYVKHTIRQVHMGCCQYCHWLCWGANEEQLCGELADDKCSQVNQSRTGVEQHDRKEEMWEGPGANTK